MGAAERPIVHPGPRLVAPLAVSPAEILFVHDGSGLEGLALPALRDIYTLKVVRLGEDEHPLTDSTLAVVICVDLSSTANVSEIRKRFVDASRQAPRIFILPNSDRRSIVQAYSAGAHELLIAPVSVPLAQQVISPLANKSAERLWGRLTDVQQSALRISLKLFEDTHKSSLRGEGLDRDSVTRACNGVISAVSHEDFPSLLDALRSHNNYTFRHSMFVTGTLVSFCDLLGFNEEDIGRATTAGLLHDIGKVVTPNAILDKPGRLDPAEMAIMRGHVTAGRDILRRDGDWPADIVHAVLHHHERLDGTGYCDGLSGAAITDLTRMVSIADVFSALIDKRAYKPAMSGRDAYQIMLKAEGHLDMDLVAAFEPIAYSIK
jgi:putative nucleotidyltransferase with HDIG domain